MLMPCLVEGTRAAPSLWRLELGVSEKKTLGNSKIPSSYFLSIHVFLWPLFPSSVHILHSSFFFFPNFTMQGDKHDHLNLYVFSGGTPPTTTFQSFSFPRWQHRVGGTWLGAQPTQSFSVQWDLIGQSWKTFLPTFQRQCQSDPRSDAP